MTHRHHPLLLLLITLVLGAISIDQRSLWTDEIGTWSLTVANGPMDWAHRFWNYHNSDGQIPLYHLFMYVWTSIAGASELSLRLANLPWLLIALTGLSRLRLDARLTSLTIGVFCLQPLLWYQLNEARPYVLHLAGACWLMVGCVNLQMAPNAESVDGSWRELLIGTFLLVGSSALGAFWIFGALLAFICCNPKALLSLIGSARRQVGFTSLLFLACGVVAVVAVHSHLSGARASLAAQFSVGGLVYGAIELLGAAGLGPSRHQLRSQLSLADPVQLGLMFASATMLTVCVVAAWRKLDTRARAMTAIGLLVPIAALACVGLFLHWRVVGRHLSGGLPLLSLGLAFVAFTAWQQRAVAYRVLGAAMLVVLVASSLAVRLAERHGKDDYRQAADWARKALAEGKTVLWLANERSIGYYRLSGWSTEGIVNLPPGLVPYTHYPAYAAAGNPPPDVIVYSPREGVDPQDIARPVLRNGNYQMTQTAIAFELHVKR